MLLQKWYYKLIGTKSKLLIGKALYIASYLALGKTNHVISRNGIIYDVDLQEGIDLSLFLFGNFQQHVEQSAHLHLPKNPVIFDVGANIGCMALHYAKHYPSARVYAFEPTDYAFKKLRRNIALNRSLMPRINPIQTFVSDKTTKRHGIKAYASWRVGGKITEHRHQLHEGIVKPASGIGAITLDEFCSRQRIKRVDFIKVDTDGHELEVLHGAKKTLQKHKPTVVFELIDSLLRERRTPFLKYLTYLEQLDYTLLECKTLRPITNQNYKRFFVKDYVEVLAKPTRTEQ